MILKVKTKVISNEVFLIKVDNEVKIIDSINSSVSFVLDKLGVYNIEIEHKIIKSNRKPLNILVFIITCIFQGVFNILLMNTETKWYKNIKAYSFKSQIFIDMQDDLEINFQFINSKYNELNNKWSLPVFLTNPRFDFNFTYTFNIIDFYNQYFNYVKKVISVGLVTLIVLAVILFISFSASNLLGIILIIFLIISDVFLVILLSLLQYKKLNEILKNVKKDN